MDGKQCTITWYMDGNNLSHAEGMRIQVRFSCSAYRSRCQAEV